MAYGKKFGRIAATCVVAALLAAPAFSHGDDVSVPQPDVPCAAFMQGTAGRDRLLGTTGGDLISGRQSGDRIAGGPGDDCLFGGGGADRLTGGPGADHLIGGRASDLFLVRDGEPDDVACGGGRYDLVLADPIDRVRSCELVRRK